MLFLLAVRDVVLDICSLNLMAVLISLVAGILAIAALLVLAAATYIMWVRKKYSHLPSPPIHRYGCVIMYKYLEITFYLHSSLIVLHILCSTIAVFSLDIQRSSAN